MKIYDIDTIEPKGILTWFKKICAIPHGSFHEQVLIQMLQENLKNADCEIITFSSGAFLARKKATAGLEKLP
jgi:di/tripeptidase